MPYYLLSSKSGLDSALSAGDGYTIRLKWFTAIPSVKTNSIAYNIYYSTNQDAVFSEGPKLISIDGSNTVEIVEFTPGQSYFFSVRPLEYNSLIYNLTQLPDVFNGLKAYPLSLLKRSITSTSLIIPLLDVGGFPSSGYVSIGAEIIQYLSIDSVNNNLILTNILQRGVVNTDARSHTVDGYDGYHFYPPKVEYYIPGESNKYDAISSCQSRFDYPNYSFTMVDGYKQVTKDLLTTDLSASDAFNVGFPSYDYAGWHRTDPAMLLSGQCVGSYMGGYMFCADGYSGVGRVLRGLSFQDHNNQRQEELLTVTGEPIVLLRKSREGIVCSCYTPASEYSDDRCPKCFGTKFVIGYEQYFNPRRSDGRIMVRFSPAEEDLKVYEAGMESEYNTDVWTLTVPTIKDRDILVRYDQNGNEEFRYEVLSVTRQRTILTLEGGQKMRVQRIRKYDPAYQIRLYSDSSPMPSKLNTTIGFVIGIPPHTHEVILGSSIKSIYDINQTTSVSQGHNHTIVSGKVIDVLGHGHKLIIP